MKIKILKNEREYDAALKQADELFTAKPNTPQGEELALLLLVIKEYEDKHHAVLVPDAVAVIKMHMKEHGMKNKDLEPFIGSKGYVSQILNKHKPLTADMMRSLHQKLGIPANILLAA
jgi:HTH-type transcriptional regulator/antitoxin HigA